MISKNVYVNGFYEKINDAVNKHISDGQYIFATILDNNDDNIIYYSQNNIGSTTLLTDKNGGDIGQFLYTPFGEMWVEEASSVDISHITRFFTNQQYDKESGLYYMNARYYDPHLGSFITPDPSMSGLNHYAYANSNPIKYTDPTGLFNSDEFWNKMCRADFLWDIIVSGGAFLLVAFLVEYFTNDPDNAPVANINISANSGSIPLGENGSYNASYNTTYNENKISEDVYGGSSENNSSNNEEEFSLMGELLKMTYLTNSLNTFLSALKRGQHDQQELYGIFGNEQVGNLACDFTAIYNNLEIRNNIARTPEQFRRDAQMIKDAGLIKGNGGYRTDIDINIVRERIANFLNQRVFAKDRFGINEYVSFNFIDKSEINTYSIIQNTTIQNSRTHFVNVVSINGNMVKIRDTFNGNIKSLDLNGSGFNNDKTDWKYSFTNMNFYLPGGN